MLAGLGLGCQETALPFVTGTPATQQVAAEPGPCAEAADHAALVQDVLNAVNAERAKRLVPPLKTNATLMQVADFYSCRLIDGRFFDHVDPYDGSTVDTRVSDFGYPFAKIGENLAAGQRSGKAVVADWMQSPAHKANLLDPTFTETGIAVKTGGDLGWYWVQEFGKPSTVSSAATTTAPTGTNPQAGNNSPTGNNLPATISTPAANSQNADQSNPAGTTTPIKPTATSSPTLNEPRP